MLGEHNDHLNFCSLYRDTEFISEKLVRSAPAGFGVSNGHLADCKTTPNCVCSQADNTERHLDYLISEFVNYYNHHRSHMERGYLPSVRSKEPEPVETLKLSDVVVNSHVGGLVKSFERRAV